MSKSRDGGRDAEVAVQAAVDRFQGLFAAGSERFAHRAFAVPGGWVGLADVVAPGLFLVTVYTADGEVLGARSVLVAAPAADRPDEPVPRILKLKGPRKGRGAAG